MRTRDHENTRIQRENEAVWFVAIVFTGTIQMYALKQKHKKNGWEEK